MTPRFGVWTPLPHTIRPEPRMGRAIAAATTPGGEGTDPATAMALDIVCRAEQLGFAATLIAERWLGPDLSAWLLSAAIAARTSRIEILTAIHPGVIDPAQTAKLGASLDRISNGRFSVNLVTGWFERELAMFGQGALLDDRAARYRRMEEFLRVLTALWSGENVNFAGEFYQLADAALPLRPRQAPRPPIYAASRDPAGRDIVATHADAWFVQTPTGTWDYALIRPAIAAAIADMSARADRAGRRLTYAISGHVICADTQGAAEAAAAELAAIGATDPISAVAARALGAGLVGTPAMLIERIADLADLGIELLMLHFHPMEHGMEAFAAGVMPHFVPTTLQKAHA